MIIHDVEQRTDRWFDVRSGNVTASNADKVVSKPKKNGEATAGKKVYILDLALESLYGRRITDEPGYENADMRRGRELEPDGVALYEVLTGELVQPVGFIQHDTLPIGCSPDGIVGDFDGGLELKCPRRHTHYRYLQHGTVPSEYLPQILHSLFVTGLPWWDFCSYCPDMPTDKRLFRVRVPRRDVEMDSYALMFALFWAEVERVKADLQTTPYLEREAHA